jgi:hypothetical protein
MCVDRSALERQTKLLVPRYAGGRGAPECKKGMKCFFYGEGRGHSRTQNIPTVKTNGIENLVSKTPSLVRNNRQ